ncbi:hypothetical protein KY333_00470 [Candidatus Woesearchaeota archaeon]|nr:hypothetical protein [Candidatus Woesearchaeota archaeon]
MEAEKEVKVEKTSEEIEKEKKDQKKIRLVAVVVVVGFIILFFAVFFGVKYVYPEPEPYETVTFNSFEFTKIAGTWYAQWQHENRLVSLALRFNPYEVENVSVVGDISEEFQQSKVYITFDPYSEDDSFKYLALASAELSQSIVKAFNKQIIPACTRYENETCENVSIVTCDDKDKAVIHLVAGEPTQIIMQDNCVTLQGKDFELLKSVDKLLYLWYKII